MDKVAYIKDAIMRYFNDTSRSQEETLNGLDEILEHTEELRNTLAEELGE